MDKSASELLRIAQIAEDPKLESSEKREKLRQLSISEDNDIIDYIIGDGELDYSDVLATACYNFLHEVSRPLQHIPLKST